MPPTPASPAQQVTIKLMIFNFIIPGVLWCVVSCVCVVYNLDQWEARLVYNLTNDRAGD